MRAFTRLYNNKGYKPEDLFEVEEYKDLINETSKLFNSTITHETSEILRSYLQRDSFIFSGLKIDRELTEASSYLLDDKGNIMPYHQFEQKVLKLNDTYNRDYLKAEHGFAVHSSQAAHRWELASDDDGFLLQYRTAGDNRVRAGHKELNGITLPKSDKFWLYYYTPNGWRCRCIVVVVLADRYEVSNSEEALAKGKKATTQIGKNGKNRLEMFRFNPGAQKKMFPPKNYYNPKNCNGEKLNLTGLIGLSDFVLSVESERCKAKKIIEQYAKKYKRIYNPKTIKKYKNGGQLIQCDLVDVKASDYERVLKVADFWAKQGDIVEIMPKLNTFNDPLYDILFKELKNTKYFGKMPDLKRNNVFYEHEGFTSENLKSAFKKMCNRGLKQSSKIVIDDCGLKDGYMIRSIIGQVKSGVNVEEVWIRKDKKLRLLYKKN